MTQHLTSMRCEHLEQCFYVPRRCYVRPQNKSGMLWNAIRVGAALYAASIVAGASVLMPYFWFSWSIASSSFARLFALSSESNRFSECEPVRHQPVQTHADKVRLVVSGALGFCPQAGTARRSESDYPGTRLARFRDATRASARRNDSARAHSDFAAPKTLLPARSNSPTVLCVRSRIAALCSSLCATAQLSPPSASPAPARASG